MLQGQGGGTLDKERKIGSAEAIGMQIVNSLAKRQPWRRRLPYFHLDLNAGSGWNDIAGCPGSPVVFCELAQRRLTAVPIYAWFCDRDQESIEKLERCLVQHGHLPQPGITLCCEDNRAIIGRFAKQIAHRDRPQHALGSLLCDPNTWFWRAKNGSGVPADEIVDFAAEFPCIDIILNMNYRWYAMAKGATARGKTGFDDVMSPHQIRAKLNRRHWLVSRQHLGGNNRFWLAIGRNTPTRDHRALGLVHWDTEAGQEIINVVSGGRQGSFDDQLEASRRDPLLLPLFDDEEDTP